VNPYERGRRDFNVGTIANPYSHETKEGKDWEYGFTKAYFLNLKKVKNIESKKLSRRSQEIHQ